MYLSLLHIYHRIYKSIIWVQNITLLFLEVWTCKAKSDEVAHGQIGRERDTKFIYLLYPHPD